MDVARRSPHVQGVALQVASTSEYLADSLCESNSYLQQSIVISSRHGDEGGAKGSTKRESRKQLMLQQLIALPNDWTLMEPGRINQAEAPPPTNGQEKLYLEDGGGTDNSKINLQPQESDRGLRNQERHYPMA